MQTGHLIADIDPVTGAYKTDTSVAFLSTTTDAFAWSADGRSFAFVSDGNVQVLDAAGGTTRNVAPAPCRTCGPRSRPTGPPWR